MHLRRIATFLLGAWLAGSLMMAYIATRNFAAVNGILQNPSVPLLVTSRRLPPDGLRLILRHMAGEENRQYFESWELSEFALGLALAAVLLLDRKRKGWAPMILCAITLLLVLFEHYKLTPLIVSLGRAIEFLPALPVTPDRARFGNLHAAYGIVEIVKMLLIASLAALLFHVSHRRRVATVREASGQ